MSAAVSPAPFERSRNQESNLVYKSGPLFISSKGLGWKSWKRRWFILTRTSLVFFKNDPNAVLHKGSDMNLTLGGIDLNNSGSVVVRAEKKLLTVLFPDERVYTLKAETIEDVDEWKDALERALEAAPNAALVAGTDRRAVKSLVIGRPILLALEDTDGSPSFLEKALSFIEIHGVGVEGILRQCADVDDVDRRVKEYEQGRNQFTPDEDAHVISDCIKHVLRELPSPPVSAPCCTALLKAHRLEGKESRVNAMRTAISNTSPEPNHQLLQRLLRMMRAVSAHTAQNRMTASAVAACMAPLLLRPLLAGECELDDNSDVTADNESQLLVATAAANNAVAILTMLLEDYDSIFEEEDVQRGPLSSQRYGGHMEARASDASSEDDDDDDEASHVICDVDGAYHDAPNNLQEDIDVDAERALSGTFSESSGNLGSNPFHHKVFEHRNSEYEVSAGFGSLTSHKGSTKPWCQSVNLGIDEQSNVAPALRLENRGGLNISKKGFEGSPWGDSRSPPFSNTQSRGNGPNVKVKPCGSTSSPKRTSLWGFSSANTKTLNMDVNDSSGEEDLAIHHLEVIRNDLRNRIAKEKYFHVKDIRYSQSRMVAAVYLQVSIISQALIFVTRSQSWSFMERPGLLLVFAFIAAQLIATLIAVYAHWGFANIRGFGWGWAGVIWLYDLVTYFPLDILKFVVRYILSGKAWEQMMDRKTAFTRQRHFGKEAREAQWAHSQRLLHGLHPPELKGDLVGSTSPRELGDIADQAKRRAEIARLRELHTLKGHVESVVRLKNLDIDTIRQSYIV